VSEDTLKRVTIRVPEELHEPARVKIARLDTSFQVILTDLLARWTHDGKALTPAASPRPAGTNLELHQMVDTIMAHGDPEMKTMLKRLLRVSTDQLAGPGAIHSSSGASKTKKAG